MRRADWTCFSRRRNLELRKVSFATVPKERPGDPSKYSSNPGRGRFGDVANQYLHPDGRGYQKFAQHRGVRGAVDLDTAGLRSDRTDPWTQNPAIEVIGDRRSFGNRDGMVGMDSRRRVSSFE